LRSKHSSLSAAPLLGVDVSTSSIKLVELSQPRAGAWRLERCAVEPLQGGWITEGVITRFEEVVEALRRLLKKTGAKAKNVAFSLPASSVITKKILLPDNMSEQEMEIQVEAEAGQYVPFPLEEVSLDFCVIGPSTASLGDVEVLIAASRRERVQDMQGLAEAVGLNPVIVDIDSYAARMAATRLIKRLPGIGDESLVALFEIGAEMTTLQIFQGENVLFEREHKFGGLQLTQLIARHYGFSPEEAETKKRNGDLPEDYRKLLLQPFVQSAAQEMGRALQFFFASLPYQAVDHILLAGGSAPLAGLPEAAAQHTGAPCSLLNPFDGMDMSSGVQQKRLAREAPSHVTACGLAMRRFFA